MIDAPVADAAAVLVTPMLIEPELEGIRLMVATTPLPMPVSLRPVARHKEVPEPWAHCKVLPAAVRAAPGLTEKLDPDDAGKVIVHCRPAGLAEPLSDRFRPADAPDAIVSDDKLNAAVCPAASFCENPTRMRIDRTP